MSRETDMLRGLLIEAARHLERPVNRFSDIEPLLERIALALEAPTFRPVVCEECNGLKDCTECGTDGCGPGVRWEQDPEPWTSACDERGKATRDALVELAIVVEFHLQLEGRVDRARKALDDAWTLIDGDGQVRAKARQECGCADCGDPVKLGDDLCDDCADVTTACCYCGKEAEGNYTIHRDGFCVGPEVPLCDEHGGSERPTEHEIWARITERRMERGIERKAGA